MPITRNTSREQEKEEATGNLQPNINLTNTGAIPKKNNNVFEQNERRRNLRQQEVDANRDLSGMSTSGFLGFDEQEQRDQEGIRQLTEIINLGVHGRENEQQNRELGQQNAYSSTDESVVGEETVRKCNFKQTEMEKKCRRSLEAEWSRYNTKDNDKNTNKSRNCFPNAEQTYDGFPKSAAAKMNQHVPYGSNIPHTNTIIYRLPVDAKNIPTFNGTSSMNPKEYIRRLEAWLEDQQIDSNGQLTWAKRSLRGSARLWDEIFCENIQTYRQWKQEFLKKYWSRENQQQVLVEIYNGKYRKSENAEMSTYFLLMMKKIKEIDLISIDEGLGLLIKHFPLDIARILMSINPRTAEKVYETLESFDQLERQHSTQKFGGRNPNTNEHREYNVNHRRNNGSNQEYGRDSRHYYRQHNDGYGQYNYHRNVDLSFNNTPNDERKRNLQNKENKTEYRSSRPSYGSPARQQQRTGKTQAETSFNRSKNNRIQNKDYTPKSRYNVNIIQTEESIVEDAGASAQSGPRTRHRQANADTLEKYSEKTRDENSEN